MEKKAFIGAAAKALYGGIKTFGSGLKSSLMGANKVIPKSNPYKLPANTTMVAPNKALDLGKNVGANVKDGATGASLRSGFGKLQKTTYDPKNKIQSAKDYITANSGALKEMGRGAAKTTGVYGGGLVAANSVLD